MRHGAQESPLGFLVWIGNENELDLLIAEHAANLRDEAARKLPDLQTRTQDTGDIVLDRVEGERHVLDVGRVFAQRINLVYELVVLDSEALLRPLHIGTQLCCSRAHTQIHEVVVHKCAIHERG